MHTYIYMCPWGGSGLFGRGQGSTTGCTWGRTSHHTPKQLNPLLNPARGQGRRRRGRNHFKSHHQNQGFCLLSDQAALLISVACSSS